ncbi:WhiB family transcriptional regulator [Embleya sp. NPDC059237]|uniref:WhiB family transcriptional regulator n=1 Tax=Embleya sp. NPDC059237 TaxID=3346784 RepID=UPI0036A0E51A
MSATNPPRPASSFRTLGDQSWKNTASCRRHVDPDLWFPGGEGAEFTERINRAKAICDWCPVRSTCLEASLEEGDRWGIRGGLTEEERKPLRHNLDRRLDRARVTAALAGRRIHLTMPEQRAVAVEARAAGMPVARIAVLLDCAPKRVLRLIREARRRPRRHTRSPIIVVRSEAA